MEDIMEILRTV